MAEQFSRVGVVPLFPTPLAKFSVPMSLYEKLHTPKKAIEVGRLLEDNGVCHFEEPCPYWEWEWTAQVTEALDVPVAGGEQDNDLAQWRRMIQMRSVDIV